MGAGMAERLAIEGVGDDRFLSVEPADEHHVFGGLLLGQALRAAAATVDPGRPACALHASFVARGKGGEPLRYDVERTRDGGSFSARRITAHQGGDPILVATADFHAEEDGAAYEPDPPSVAGPDGLAPGRYDNPWWESRDLPADPEDQRALVRRAWFRATAPIGDDLALHVQALAYVSDHGATRGAREPHAHLSDDARRQSVSLDHSIWLHVPARADAGWLLVSWWPAATGRGRGLALGSIHDEAGTLLATLAQQVLLRTRP